MSQEFFDYVEDILDEISKIGLLVDDISFEQFAADFRTNYAAVRALEIIGKATRRLPMEVCVAYPTIPWREMAGTRDRIIYATHSGSQVRDRSDLRLRGRLCVGATIIAKSPIRFLRVVFSPKQHNTVSIRATDSEATI